METWAAANEEQARYRDGGEADHWLACEERCGRMLAPFTGHLLTAAAIRRVGRVAGVGCGTGSTTRAAGRAAAGGQALDLRLSSAMPRQAARRAQQERLGNATFEHGDAPVHRFTPRRRRCRPQPFGVMFFAGPAAAFAAIGRGLRAGGRLVLVCGQSLAGNEWVCIVVPGAAAARTWRSHPPVIGPLRDRSRWAIAAGLPPCRAPRCSATSRSSTVASDVWPSTPHGTAAGLGVSPDAAVPVGCLACGQRHA